MPVYLRKNMNMSPPRGEPAELDLDGPDFVGDPDQVKDRLPQPFRMVDKVVGDIVDDAWEIIKQRVKEKVEEASRLRPPKYECGVHLKQDTDDVCTMADSKDGRYIIMGMTHGLVVIDAHTQHVVAHWKQDGVEITTIQVSSLGDQMYLLSTIDDLGTARLFSLAGEAIYHMHTMNEQGDGAKVNAAICQSSADGDYVGIYLESSNIADCALEIHKIPKDVWVKELENLVAKAAAKKEAAAQAEHEKQEAPVEFSHPSEGPQATADDDNRSQSPGSTKGESNQTHKFSAPTIVLKVKPPASLVGTVFNSAAQAAKTIDSTGEVIGHGATHMLSTSHLEQRKANFDQQHSHYLKFLPSEPKPTIIEPAFHFLQPTRPLPHGLEQPAIAGQPTIVIVWWSGHTNVMHYSLAKQAKVTESTNPRDRGDATQVLASELEHKPDLVWPLSSSVVCSTTTPCSSLVAVGLQNNNIVVWDSHLGMPRRVTHVTDHGKILKLQFLEPSICPQTDDDAPYSLRTCCYLMVTCSDGQLFTVNVGMADTSTVQEVALQVVKPEEMPSMIMPIHGIPELILTCRQNGTLFIHDLLKCTQLCEVTLPKTHKLATPWSPVVAVGASGQMLYLKGTAVEEEPAEKVDTEENEAEDNENTVATPTSKVFGFTLRSFPALDRYRMLERPEVPFYVHTTVEKRVDALMRERISNQGLRQGRMQQRWNQLKSELKTIQNIKEAAHSKPKSAYAPSTIPGTPLMIGGRVH